MTETLFDPEQIVFPNRRENGRFMTVSGLARMRQAAQFGDAFARRYEVVHDKASEMEQHADIRKRGGEALAAYHEKFRDPTCARLMRVAFAFGAILAFHSDEMYGFVGPGTTFFEVEAQRDLALICRVIQMDDRHQLYKSHELLEFPDDRWLPMISGAHAVADFVEAVQRGGLKAHLPTAKEDARDGIDVLIPAGPSGFCVQVKRNRDARGIAYWPILSEPRGSGGGKDHGTLRRTWMGTHAFNARYNVTWIPAFAEVGKIREIRALNLAPTIAT